jgi:exonuclease SbcC
MRFADFALDDLPDRGLIGIFGDNECGKSSIGELICFCLFGRTTKAPDGDPGRIVRWGETECETEIVFSVGHEQYRIQRTLGAEGLQQGLMINLATGERVAGQASDIEAAVSDRLNYGFKEFRYSTYIAQNELDIILHSASDRRDVLNSMLGVGLMEKISRRVADKRRDQDVSLDRHRRRMDDKSEVRAVYQARRDDLFRVEAELDERNRDLVAALRERDALVSTYSLLEEIRRKSEQFNVLDSRIKSRREHLRKLEAEAADLMRETDRIPRILEDSAAKEERIQEISSSSMQELEDKFARIDQYRKRTADRDTQVKVIERKEADLAKITKQLETYEGKEDRYKKAAQELTSIEFFLESFSGEQRFQSMVSNLMKDTELLETELQKVRDAFIREYEYAVTQDGQLASQIERMERQLKSTTIEEVTADQLATLQAQESAVSRNRDISIAVGMAAMIIGAVLTLILGNMLFLIAAAPLIPAWGAAYAMQQRLARARQRVVTAQQKFYAFNITQRSLIEIEESLEESREKRKQAKQDITARERLVDACKSIYTDCFADLGKSVDTIENSAVKELARARAIMEEILTGYENLRSLVSDDLPFLEIAGMEAGGLLSGKHERREELKAEINSLTKDIQNMRGLVSQSETLLDSIAAEKAQLNAIEDELDALGVTDVDEPDLKKEIQSLDLQVEQLHREIEENKREIERIRARADEASVIEDKRKQVINEIDADLIHFYELKEATRDIDCTDERFADMQVKKEEAGETIVTLRESVAGLDAQRKIIRKDLERATAVEQEIQQLQDQALDMENHVLKLRELENLFLSTGLDIKKRLIPQIESYFAWIMPRLTRGRYHQVRLSDDFDISVYSDEKGDYVSLDTLSGGTMDQLLIALRLAFARAATSGSYYPNQFLFLDEPISAFDESRRELFFDLLETLKEGFQQIFLISHLPHLEEFVDCYMHVTLNQTTQPAAQSWA